MFNKVKICWGIGKGSSSVSITLPIAYTEYYSGGFAFSTVDDTSTLDYRNMSMMTKTLTGFTTRNAANSNFSKLYITVGY